MKGLKVFWLEGHDSHKVFGEIVSEPLIIDRGIEIVIGKRNAINGNHTYQ